MIIKFHLFLTLLNRKQYFKFLKLIQINYAMQSTQNNEKVSSIHQHFMSNFYSNFLSPKKITNQNCKLEKLPIQLLNRAIAHKIDIRFFIIFFLILLNFSRNLKHFVVNGIGKRCTNLENGAHIWRI